MIESMAKKKGKKKKKKEKKKESWFWKKTSENKFCAFGSNKIKIIVPVVQSVYQR